MRQSPEALIARLRNRKRRIVGHSIVLVAFLGVLIVSWASFNRWCAGCVPVVQDNCLGQVVFPGPMVSEIVFAQALMLLSAATVGCVLVLLFLEKTMSTKDDLLVSLWDRVQALERSQQAAL